MHKRLMVIANRTCPCPDLPDEVAAHLDPPSGEVHVVAPALNSRLRHWVSDSDAATAQATTRLHQALGALREVGLRAEGAVGDADPLLAIHDALAEFDADAILLSTWPEGDSNWLERDLLGRAREQLDLPVHHVVSRFGVAPASTREARVR